MRIMLLLIYFLMHLALLNSQKTHTSIVPIVNTDELLSLIDKKDDTVRLFNFWATWCVPCVKELPYFEEINNTRGKEKFKLYLISLDFKKSITKKLIPFIKRNKINATVILFDGGNPNDWIDKIDPSWSGTIPASLITFNGSHFFEENSFEDSLSLNTFIQNFINRFKS